MEANPARKTYTHQRIAHWDMVAHRYPKSQGRYYHQRNAELYSYVVSPGQKVLELGCGTGDLLASLSPSDGLGIDFSSNMIGEAIRRHPHLNFISADAHDVELSTSFDIIVMNDLLNDVWDVQQIFKNISRYCHEDTRIVMNVFSRLWQPALDFARYMGWATSLLRQNWLTPNDLQHLLHLESYEVVKKFSDILFPAPIPVLSRMMNRYLTKLFPFRVCNLTNMIVARKLFPERTSDRQRTVSVIVPARNEAGNIPEIVRRIPRMGSWTEIVFVEGGSTDGTSAAIQRVRDQNPELKITQYTQKGQGKGDAVRLGFSKAAGDVLMILDADMTVPPEDLTRFYDALVSGKGEFINGVRLVYPMDDQAMRFFNLVGNKFFSLSFSWLLGQSIKDTLCGTKVLTKKNYQLIAANRSRFGDFDPFGDFDLLFGASCQNMQIIDVPIRYQERVYGQTNIQRWKHGVMLLKMVLFAARKIKFI